MTTCVVQSIVYPIARLAGDGIFIQAAFFFLKTIIRNAQINSSRIN